MGKSLKQLESERNARSHANAPSNLANSEQVRLVKSAINVLTHEEMCRIWLFAPTNHDFMKRGPIFTHFHNRLRKLGGVPT
jgi:hypothetical protein